MKSCKKLLLFFTVYILSFADCFSQISNRFFQSLPDSLKPADKDRVTLSEINAILKHAFKYSDWQPYMYQQADKLSYKFGGHIHKAASIEDRYEFLHTLCSYLYYSKSYNKNRGHSDRNAEDLLRKQCRIGIYYCDEFIKEFPDKVITSKFYLSNVYMYKAHFLVDLDKHIDAYYELQRSMQIARQRNLPTSVSLAYGSMAFIVGVLDLSDQALANYDSAFAAIKDELQSSPWVAGQRVYLWHCKQLAYLSKFRKTRQGELADSVMMMYRQVKSEKRQFSGAVEAESNVAMAAVEYESGNYRNSLAYIDSAKLIYPDMQRLGSYEDAIAYRALNLLRLGKSRIAQELIGNLNFAKLTAPVAVLVFEELYKNERVKGNLSKALEYQDRLLGFIRRKSVLDLRGRSLAMEQFYNAREKERQINVLKRRQVRNYTFAAAGLLFLIIACGVLWQRYKSSKANGKKLIDLVEKMTHLHALQIEQAKVSERKLFAQDLHDDLSASIAAAVNFLKLMSLKANDEKDRRDAFRMKLLLRESYDRVRYRSHTIYWYDQTKSYIKRIEEMIDVLFLGTSIKISFASDLDGIELNDEAKTTILLVLKESITNIIKHANASEVEFTFYIESDSIVADIFDNGRGDTDFARNSSLGIESLRQRVRVLNGVLNYTHNKPIGTMVSLILPLSSCAVSAGADSNSNHVS